MVDYKKLNDKVKNSGLKKNYIAKKLGLTPYGLAKKLSGETEFKASEMAGISDVLKLTGEMREEIFFAQLCDFESPTA